MKKKKPVGTSVYFFNENTETKVNKFAEMEKRSKSNAIARLVEIALRTPEVKKILEKEGKLI